MAQPYGKAISGNSYKTKNSCTIFNAGNASVSDNAGAVTNNFTIRSSIQQLGSRYGTVIPAVSSTAGTAKPISAGTYRNFDNSYFVAKVIGTKIAGVATTLLRSGTSEFGQRRISALKIGDRRYNVTSWNYATGRPTKGGNAGDNYTFGSSDDSRGTAAEPGEIVYMKGGLTPYQDGYKPRYL